MNRRGFLQGLFAAAALTTGLARTRLDLVLDPLRNQEDLIALMERKIRAAEKAMCEQMTEGLYGGGYLVPPEHVPALEKAIYEWRESRVVIGVRT